MFVTRDGTRLWVDDRGSGEPVFLHTGTGGDGTMWETAGYLDHLAGRRCLLFDHRGHGRSDQPREAAEHSFAAYVEDTVAVLDALELERAALVGYSDGAQVCLGVAAYHPGRVSALVLLGDVDGPDDDPASRRAMAAAIRARGVRSFIDAMSAREQQPAPAWLVENLVTTSDELFALELEGWADGPSEWQLLASVQAPTLIVVGGQESSGAGKVARQAADVLPGGAVQVLEGFGHLQTFWRVDVTGPLVRDWLDLHPG